MASPGRDFDPNRKYKLVLSERLKASQLPHDHVYSAVNLEPSLKLPQAVKSASVISSGDGSSISLTLDGPKPNEKYVYRGEHSDTQSVALYFNASNQTFILDSIDSELTFTEEYEVPSETGSLSGDEVLDSLKAQEGAAEESNPFDWRHQLRKADSDQPEPFDPISLDALRTPSPDQYANRPKPRERRLERSRRQASTPPSEIDLGGEVETKSEPEARSPPSVHSHSAKSASPKSPQSAASSLARSSPSVAASSTASPPRRRRDSPPPESSSDSDNGGGLEIVDPDGEQRKRGRQDHRMLLRNAGDGPISLRSAANSRSPRVGVEDLSEDDDRMRGVRAFGASASPSPFQPSAPVAVLKKGAVKEWDRPKVDEARDGDTNDPGDAGDADVEMADDDDALLAAFNDMANEDDEEEDAGEGGVSVGQFAEDSSSESEEE